MDESQDYINNIEEKMGADDPAGLALLHEHLGRDLTELKSACTAMLASTQLASSSQLVWNPNASDNELIACLKDIIDAMAAATGSTLAWKQNGPKPKEESTRIMRRSSRSWLHRSTSCDNQTPALHLVCNCDEAMADARVLQVSPCAPLCVL